jgi:hypothetical protein
MLRESLALLAHSYVDHKGAASQRCQTIETLVALEKSRMSVFQDIYRRPGGHPHSIDGMGCSMKRAASDLSRPWRTCVGTLSGRSLQTSDCA